MKENKAAREQERVRERENKRKRKMRKGEKRIVEEKADRQEWRKVWLCEGCVIVYVGREEEEEGTEKRIKDGGSDV